MNEKTVVDIVKEYEAGHISKQDLHTHLLLAADQASDHDLFVSQVPAEHLEGFAERVASYVHAESTVQVGSVRVDSPKPQTIAELHAALGRRLVPGKVVEQ